MLTPPMLGMRHCPGHCCIAEPELLLVAFLAPTYPSQREDASSEVATLFSEL